MVDLPEKAIRSISTGHYHSFALTAFGDLYSWGRNREFQVKFTDKVELKLKAPPCRIDDFGSSHVSQVHGSGVISMAILDNGTVWGWGSSKRGQLGLGFNVLSSYKPKQIKGDLDGKYIKQVWVRLPFSLVFHKLVNCLV